MSEQDRCTVSAKCTIGSEIIWTHPMELLGDEAQVESSFGSFGVLVQLRCTVSSKQGSEIILIAPDRTPW